MADRNSIVVDSVSKCFRIYDSPKDRIKQFLLGKILSSDRIQKSRGYYREFWALRDISFELKPGESIGILGRNGAGKSTLLQVIAGTLQPTSGKIRCNGRITALLELGSGFNLEFTGKENAILNAQIIGFTEKEALERFDEIASFADIGDFINQPVKTYSSGMLMRLAFAVQSTTDPKILIVDEALAVGDVFFQAKCMTRIKRLMDDGVSVLFVSHDASSVRQLCSHALLLDRGIMIASGAPREVSQRYQSLQLIERNKASSQDHSGVQISTDKAIAGRNKDEADSPELGEPGWFLGKDIGRSMFKEHAKFERVGNGTAEFLNVQMLKQGNVVTELEFNDQVTIRLFALFKKDLGGLKITAQVCNPQGFRLVNVDTTYSGEIDRIYLSGKVYCFDWNVKLPLQTGHYHLNATMSHPPNGLNSDWEFVDMIPFAYKFFMSQLPGQPLGASVVLPSRLEVRSQDFNNAQLP
jgi:lipopolysaccharide transport system ATP-binding protein